MQSIEARINGELRVKPLQEHARDLDLYGIQGVSARTIAAREGAGVVRVDAEVLGNSAVGAYRHLTLVTPGPAEIARPGQFVALAVGDGTSSMLLRRSFSIHRVSPAGTYGATTEIVVAAAGPGTRELTRLEAGASVSVIGPLGKGFPSRRSRSRASSSAAAAAPRRSSGSPSSCVSVAARSRSCSARPRPTGSSASSRPGGWPTGSP
uniref:Uncharacterized protein n=1 Tax=Janibacter limosus TaxID=53458 RepID=A0AC61U924_9MICO|nr:hypothetical protein [Janibacter limosus]